MHVYVKPSVCGVIRSTHYEWRFIPLLRHVGYYWKGVHSGIYAYIYIYLNTSSTWTGIIPHLFILCVDVYYTCMSHTAYNAPVLRSMSYTGMCSTLYNVWEHLYTYMLYTYPICVFVWCCAIDRRLYSLHGKVYPMPQITIIQVGYRIVLK